MEKRDVKVIKKGMYKGFKYFITENHLWSDDARIDYDFRWYCCYVGIPDFIKSQVKPRDCSVHGGITFEGYLPFITHGLRFVWGWDYNHLDDHVDNPTGFMKSKLQLMNEEERLDILMFDVIRFIEEDLL